MDTQIITLLLALFGGSYGLVRILYMLVESFRNRASVDSQIALTRENTDLESVRSLHNSVTSLIELFRQQMVQEAQATIQNAQLEADKVTAQNNLATAMREATEEMRSNQRNATSNTQDILRAYRTDIDEFKATMRRDVNTIDIGFRTISDGFIFMNTQLTQVLDKINSSLDAMNAIVVRIHNDTVSMRKNYAASQENLEDVVDLVTDMRNLVVKLTQDEATAQRMYIHPYESGRRRMLLNEWLHNVPPASEDPDTATDPTNSSAATEAAETETENVHNPQ